MLETFFNVPFVFARLAQGFSNLINMNNFRIVHVYDRV